MNRVYAQIELINGGDLALVRRNIISENEIRRITISALVDTSSIMMCINENIQEQLQLPVVEKRKAQLANGHIVECDVVAPRVNVPPVWYGDEKPPWAKAAGQTEAESVAKPA